MTIDLTADTKPTEYKLFLTIHTDASDETLEAVVKTAFYLYEQPLTSVKASGNGELTITMPQNIEAKIVTEMIENTLQGAFDYQVTA